jgi:transposase
MQHYVGLDVSMKETFICIQDEAGKIIHQGQTKTDPELISEYLKKFQLNLNKVGVESGALSHWLVEELNKLNIPAICIDARKMAAVLSVQINKTDKNDARGIAEAMRCNLYRQVMQKSKSALELGTLMGSRRLMVQQKVQLTNAIRGFLKTYGIRLGSFGEKSFVKGVRDKLSDNQTLAKEGIESLLHCVEKTQEEIKKLTLKVEELAREDEDIKRLVTIPGVGVITAVSYKIEIDDPKRFKNSRAVGAYLGMTPKQYSSGETKKQGCISKCGSTEVRFLLNEAAVVMLTRSERWSKLKAWGLKIHRKHGFKKATMAVGRKLAVIMHRMLVDKSDFIYGEPKEEKNKTEDRKIGTTGLARAI